MKLIDKKGRLFGWINVLDLAVIIFVGWLVWIFMAGFQLSYMNRQMLKQVRKEEAIAKSLIKESRTHCPPCGNYGYITKDARQTKGLLW